MKWYEAGILVLYITFGLYIVMSLIYEYIKWKREYDDVMKNNK